jgi:hypothetical protein
VHGSRLTRLYLLRWYTFRLRGGRVRFPLAGVAASLLVAAALVTAVLVGLDRGEPAASTPSAELPAAAPARTDGQLRLAAPVGWNRGGRAPAIPGLALSSPAVLRQPGLGISVVAGIAAPSSRSLLPASLLRHLAQPPGAPERVRLGNRYWAYHYPGLATTSRRETMDAYVVPTTRGIVTLVCVPQDWAAATSCADAADAIRLTRGRPIPPSPDVAFRLTLPGVLARLNDERARGRRALATASTADQQERALRDVAAGFRRAVAALRVVAPAAPALPTQLIDGLERLARRYAELAGALRGGSAAQVTASRSRLLAGERELRALLSATPSA